MAKLSAHGQEVCRYFSVKSRGLVAVMADGKVLRRTPFSGWKLFAVKKSEVPLGEWIAKRREIYARLPAWQQECRSLPSMATLERWSNDSMCETPTGHQVEPDGVGPDGVPSWLILCGLI